MINYLKNRLSWFLKRSVPRKYTGAPLNNLRKLKNLDYCPKYCISGYNSATGLGYQNRDLVSKLKISRWLAIEHPTQPFLNDIEGVETGKLNFETNEIVLRKSLKDIDCLIFYEQPLIKCLPRVAQEMGIALVCIVNWEWLSPNLDWLDKIDLFICPNQLTYDILMKWKYAGSYPWEIELILAPIDTERFDYKKKSQCNSFLFINGHGGVPPYFRGILRDNKGPLNKGLDIVIEAARKIPDIPIYLRSHVRDFPYQLPQNIELLPEISENHQLFGIGDVAIQPSLFEGTCLQFLETLSTGMPLITTDSPPMNEFELIASVAAVRKYGRMGNHFIPVNIAKADDLAMAMERLYKKDITTYSLAARNYILKNHHWSIAAHLYHKAMGIKLRE